MQHPESRQAPPTVPPEKVAHSTVFTPASIAELMAARFNVGGAVELRLLDPGSGGGALLEALIRRLLGEPTVRRIWAEAFEVNAELAYYTRAKLATLRKAADATKIALDYTVAREDFLFEKWNNTRGNASKGDEYDMIIMNPPYFKIRRDSGHSRLAAAVVHGQPNIYALFLVLGLRLLRPGGQMVAICPRSWLSGQYFSRPRRELLSTASLRSVHAFESRNRAFGGSGVLQETAVFHLVREEVASGSNVQIDVTKGLEDLADPTTFTVPWKLLAPEGSRGVVRLPESAAQVAALRELGGRRTRMTNLGLRVSTGPVVAFRAAKYLREVPHGDPREVPMIWIGDVRQGAVQWKGVPNPRHPPVITRTPESAKLVVRGDDMVLVRRFSAKEDARRVVAAFVRRGALGDYVGLENHLNVIRGFRGPEGGRLGEALARYLNSQLVDAYIRAVSGTTQVNAADLRALPLPSRSELLNDWAG